MIGNEWYTVKPGSFYTDSYEFGYYVPDDDYPDGMRYFCDHGGGQSGVCATGFAFTEVKRYPSWYTENQIFGPLTSIQAVRYEAGPSQNYPVAPKASDT